MSFDMDTMLRAYYCSHRHTCPARPCRCRIVPTCLNMQSVPMQLVQYLQERCSCQFSITLFANCGECWVKIVLSWTRTYECEISLCAFILAALMAFVILCMHIRLLCEHLKTATKQNKHWVQVTCTFCWIYIHMYMTQCVCVVKKDSLCLRYWTSRETLAAVYRRCFRQALITVLSWMNLQRSITS